MVLYSTKESIGIISFKMDVKMMTVSEDCKNTDQYYFNLVVLMQLKGNRIYHSQICVLGIRIIFGLVFLRNGRREKSSENCVGVTLL